MWSRWALIGLYCLALAAAVLAILGGALTIAGNTLGGPALAEKLVGSLLAPARIVLRPFAAVLFSAGVVSRESLPRLQLLLEILVLAAGFLWLAWRHRRWVEEFGAASRSRWAFATVIGLGAAGGVAQFLTVFFGNSHICQLASRVVGLPPFSERPHSVALLDPAAFFILIVLWPPAAVAAAYLVRSLSRTRPSSAALRPSN